MSSAVKSTVVIGCGIIGLTTAIRLLESGEHPQVHVLADHLPLDPLDPSYASTAAGAHHLSFAANQDLKQRRLDARTFQVMWDELEAEEITGAEPTGLMKLTQTEYYDGEEKHLDILAGLPDFVIHPTSSLPPFATHSISFTSLTIATSHYLRRLLARFHALGGKIHRVHLVSIRDALSYVSGVSPNSVKAVVVCAGIGALDLHGVEDKDIYPTRGQVLLLRAPWCRSGWTYQAGSLSGGEGGARTYIIPRYNGQVIIGGTRDIDDWHREPRAETTFDILERALQICPQLAPLAARLSGRIPEPSDLLSLVEAEIVGFRPSRRPKYATDSGLRLEKGEPLSTDYGETDVVYNYGHGGFGWQSCWGCAEEVVELLGGPKAPEVGAEFRKAAGLV
ncbi:FAD dependent oxidoreductase [Phellopilus nigrolimitatus]|nr:FAD dependent oxidoreductase [Phellopilus nigrolimitatus]